MDDVKGLCEGGGDYWDRPLVDRLTERAALARAEGTGTAVADATHFEQAATALTAAQARIRELEAQVAAYEAARSAEPVAPEIGEEEIARALCRRQIIANLRYDMPRDDEEQFIQRCEDASWDDDAWLGPARAVLALLQPALERARRLEAMATAYDVGDGIRVERRNANAWAVCWQNDVLNTEGKWEWEPMPSNRGKDFIARTRHPFDEAWRLAEAAIRKGSGE